MNFVNELNTASTSWGNGDVIVADLNDIYLIISSVTSLGPTKYYLLDVDTSSVYTEANSLSELKERFIVILNREIIQVIAATNLKLVADEI